MAIAIIIMTITIIIIILITIVVGGTEVAARVNVRMGEAVEEAVLQGGGGRAGERGEGGGQGRGGETKPHASAPTLRTCWGNLRNRAGHQLGVEVFDLHPPKTHKREEFDLHSLLFLDSTGFRAMSLQDCIEEITAPGGSFEISQQTIVLDGSADHHKGVSYRCFTGHAAPKVLPDLYARSTEWADDVFITYSHEDERVRLTYGAALAEANTLALALQKEYKVQKGERVAIASRNYPEWMLAFMGATSMGAMCLPVNALWKTDELEYGMNDSGSSVLFVDQERMERLLPLLPTKCPQIRALIVIRPTGPLPTVPGVDIQSYESVLAKYAGQTFAGAVIDQDDVATLMYTSGTTGAPKGVVSTHRNIVSAINMLLVQREAGQLLQQKRGKVRARKQDAMLCPVPLFHVTGSHSIFLGSFVTGRKLCLMYKWDALLALKTIQEEAVTQMTGEYRQYTHTTYTLHTHYIHTTHTLHTHYTHTIHSLYTHCTLTVHSLYTHCTLTVHSLYTHCTLTTLIHRMHIPPPMHPYTHTPIQACRPCIWSLSRTQSLIVTTRPLYG
jgi:hypothetical protein